MPVSIIVAMAENGVIGRGGKLPWHLPDDLRRFKQLTMGHTIVMGRRTWESIGRALPGRQTIVVSRQSGFRVNAEGVRVASSLEEAVRIATAAADTEIFVVGGSEMYREAISRATRMYITRIEAVVAGDTVFPTFDQEQWRLLSAEPHTADDKHQFPFTFEAYERR